MKAANRFDLPSNVEAPGSNSATADPPSAPEILKQLVERAERAGVSDIHLQTRRDDVQVSFRRDGVLTPVTMLPSATGERVLGRIKFLARLKTYQDSLPQDGRIERSALDTETDLRVATYPTVTGEKIVLRLFRPGAAKTVDDLGFDSVARTEVENFLGRPTGLLLLTGPAGSGKTTTIYACLRQLAETPGRHIITIEEPVEQLITGTMQTEVNEAVGLNFARAARHLLRQDPQALVIGEIRDEDTANLAIRAGLTGHLVISTLHAGSCVGVLERLLVMCPDTSAVASALDLVVNQRLMRRLCDVCHGQGCATCLQTGYQGRVPIVEWLRMDENSRTHIRQHDLPALAPARSLDLAAKSLINRGITNEAEYRRVLGL